MNRRNASFPLRQTLASAPLLLLAGLSFAQRVQPLPPLQRLTLEQILTQPNRWIPEMPRLAWIPGGAFYTEIATQNGEEVLIKHAVVGRLRETMVSASLLSSAVSSAKLSAKKLPPIAALDPHTVRFLTPTAVYHWDLNQAEPVRVLARSKGAVREAIASGDQIGAYIVDHDLVIMKASGGQRRITWDGSPDMVYGDAAHRAEMGIIDGLWWDPTGRFLAFSREDKRPIARYPYADYKQRPAEPLHGRYPMAGLPHSRVTIGVYDAETAKLIYLEHDSDADVYWTNVTFHPKGAEIYVALVNRGQDHMDLTAFDSLTGARKTVLFSESDKAWVEPEHGPFFIDDEHFLWLSQRDGHNDLYQYNRGGQLVQRITNGDIGDITKILSASTDGTIHVVASGSTGDSENGRVDQIGTLDPRASAIWQLRWSTDARRWDITPRGPTTGTNTASITAGNCLLLRNSGMNTPGLAMLIVKDSAKTIHTATNPFDSYRVGKPEHFTLTTADNTKLYGLLIKPFDFDRRLKYPVIHYVYGGPHAQLVQDRWLGGANLWLYYMAANGYVVHIVDNRGTPNRGKAFYQSIHRNLGDLEVADQLFAIEELKKKPWVDGDRIGVHGWSYGGYMSMRLCLKAPKLFKACVSGAPVTDWARYETGYGERYMDTPEENPEGYAAASNLKLAKELETRLLLVHGTDDKTVMFSHSMAFLQACIDAGKDIEFMAYPMQKHGLRGKARKHFYKKMTKFFAEHL